MTPDSVLITVRDILLGDEVLVGMFKEGFEEAGENGVHAVLRAFLLGLGRDHKLTILAEGSLGRLSKAIAIDEKVDVGRAARFAREARAMVAGHMAEMRSFGLNDGR